MISFSQSSLSFFEESAILDSQARIIDVSKFLSTLQSRGV